MRRRLAVMLAVLVALAAFEFCTRVLMHNVVITSESTVTKTSVVVYPYTSQPARTIGPYVGAKN